VDKNERILEHFTLKTFHATSVLVAWFSGVLNQQSYSILGPIST